MSQSFIPLSQGQKRPYSAAFNKQATSLPPRPQAAPAVPSFGGDILPTSTLQTISAPEPKKKPRKYNQLGLTPASQDHESSSDEDEEAKLATKAASGTLPNAALLQVEYGGQIATLHTAADIAAWVAERKRKFPTVAKAEAAKREAEEKRSKWEEAKKERAEVLRLQRLQQEKSRQSELRKRALESLGSKKAKKDGEGNRNVAREKKDDNGITKEVLKMEKLKRKLEKAQRHARKAEQALAQMQQSSVTIEDGGREGTGSIADIPSKPPGAATLATPPFETHKQQPRAVDELAKLKADLLKDEDVNDASSNASVTSIDMDDMDDDEDEDTTSSSGSSSNPFSGSEADSDSDRPPDQITSKRTAPDRVPPPPRIDPSSKPSHASEENKTDRARNPCRNMLRTGRCQFGRRCRYSHDLSSSMDGPGGGVRDGGDDTRKDQRSGDAAQARGRQNRGQVRESGTGKAKREAKPGRKGLYQIMVEKEMEAEKRAVVAVILEMGKKGMLGQTETET
jgi:Nuclear fragile X mental retardation-interacting protein 1 (NUFIP1)/Zinc finger C-x8-C-x5-C-x3-H type (and similar)